MTHTEYMREWRKDPKNRIRQQESRERWVKRNPNVQKRYLKSWAKKSSEKSLAQHAVYRAVRKGILIRPNHCEECGLVCIPNGHHEDYSQRLKVDWLCHFCHFKRHRSVQ